MMQRLGIFPPNTKIKVETEEELSLLDQSKIDIELIDSPNLK